MELADLHAHRKSKVKICLTVEGSLSVGCVALAQDATPREVTQSCARLVCSRKQGTALDCLQPARPSGGQHVANTWSCHALAASCCGGCTFV